MSDLANRVAGVGAEIVLQKQQQAAMWALREGMNLNQAADKAQVARMTLYRWIQKDPNFRAAYNLWQQEVAETARARLLKLADKAVDAVEKELTSGDARLAVTVLKQLGVLRRARGGSSEPGVVGMQMEMREGNELRRVKRAMAGGMEVRMRKARRRLLRRRATGMWEAILDAQDEASEEVEEEGVTPMLHDGTQEGEEPGQTQEGNSVPERE